MIKNGINFTNTNEKLYYLRIHGKSRSSKNNKFGLLIRDFAKATLFFCPEESSPVFLSKKLLKFLNNSQLRIYRENSESEKDFTYGFYFRIFETQLPTVFETDDANDFVLTDVDMDGDIDIVTSSLAGGNEIRFNQGNGLFGQQTTDLSLTFSETSSTLAVGESATFDVILELFSVLKITFKVQNSSGLKISISCSLSVSNFKATD